MKQILALLLVAMMLPLHAQGVKPTIEKVDDTHKATFYHENGEIAQTGFLLNGKPHGQWLMYDNEGNKMAAAIYKEGSREGKWLFWDKEGNLKEVDYHNNKIMHVKQWNNYEIVSIQ